jgi:hypothetical protein
LIARYGQEDQPETVLQKVSQEMLAEMIGTTRSRVNLFMNKFKKLGFIEYNGGIKINKSLLNQQIPSDRRPARIKQSTSVSFRTGPLLTLMLDSPKW